MRNRKFVLRVSAAGLCAGAAIALIGVQTAAATNAGRTVLAGTAAPAQAQPAGAVSSSSVVKFALLLTLRDESGAKALVQAVSSPGSPSYRHYLTASQWEARFSPTSASVGQAEAWLRGQGFSVGAVSKDRLTIAASGTAAQVESAFGTTLQNYSLNGQTVRMATSDLSVPSSLSGIVEGAVGINQHVATAAAASPDSVGNPDIPGSNTGAASGASSPGEFPPAPPAFLIAPPCGAYYGASSTTPNPPFGQGYPTTVPNVVCGYKPSQYRSAYGVSTAATGKGVTVAIIDAYGSSTIAQDATRYFNQNDQGNSFSNAHFTQIDSTPFTNVAQCNAPSWLVEQAIDVEAVHSTAPNAHILYYGATSCFDTDLFAAEQNVIDNHLADVVSNSWADTGGDLLVDAAEKTAFDDLFMLAGTTGMTIQFSSGDDGDNFYLFGFSSANYPSESPFVTAVGGTSLQIGSNGQRISELGWDTGRSFLCSSNLVNLLCAPSQLNTWLPAGPDGISGGYTSTYYTQPWYQAPVVPAALAFRNTFIGVPTRVIPDISADADPGTGFLIGLHQTLPGGTSTYTTTRYGGTSLASPLLAGIVADADQAAGIAVGFINPNIYGLDLNQPSTIYDVLPQAKQGNFRNDYAGATGLGLPTTGFASSFRELYYRGPETYCDATGNCASRQEPLTTTKGYDSLTGIGSPGANFINALAGR
jgi:subtilase family serine protease